MVTATLLPEPYWVWQGNAKGIAQRAVAVTVGPFGTILVLDQGQPEKTGRVLKARLHYPMNVEVIIQHLHCPLDIHDMDGIAFLTDKATIFPKRMSKRELFAFAVDKAIVPEDAGLGDYTCPVL